MVDCHCEDDFYQTLNLLKEFSKEKIVLFWKYFDKNYLSRRSKWALIDLKRYEVRTNMHLKSFHKVLKINYFNKKRNKRCDLLLSTLKKYFEDRVNEFDKKYSVQHRKIIQKHYVAIKSKLIIEKIDDNTYNVIVIL